MTSTIEAKEVPAVALIANVLVAVVVAIHVYIVILEMFLWRTERGMQAFGTDQAFADQSAPLAANQGLYNGFLVAGLVWGLIAADPIGFQVKVFFLACVVVAGLYGAATVSRRILVVQALPAALALVAVAGRREHQLNGGDDDGSDSTRPRRNRSRRRLHQKRPSWHGTAPPAGGASEAPGRVAPSTSSSGWSRSPRSSSCPSSEPASRVRPAPSGSATSSAGSCSRS